MVALSSRRNIPAAWTPTILNKIGPIVGDAIHDTDIMLWFTGDRVASTYAQTVDVRGLKHPDIGQTMYRFKGGATATLAGGCGGASGSCSIRIAGMITTSKPTPSSRM